MKSVITVLYDSTAKMSPWLLEMFIHKLCSK